LVFLKSGSCQGADKAKVVMQIHTAGMAPYFEDRIFSGHDLPRSKQPH
jgi:hypothetical protein